MGTVKGISSDVERSSLQFAWQYAQNYAATPEGWVVLAGPHGSGKTHLAVAIANESLRRNSPVFYAFVPALLDHLRATFRPDSLIGYDEIFEQVKTVPLLILDDLGAEASTAWADEKLYQIFVHRHEARLPTVITTTSLLEELETAKPRLASRLVDSNVVEWVIIVAPNYRDQRRGGRSARSRYGSPALQGVVLQQTLPPQPPKHPSLPPELEAVMDGAGGAKLPGRAFH